MKVLKAISSGISVILLLVVVFGAGAASMHFFPGWYGIKEEKAVVVDETNDDTFDLKMPGEAEKRVPTVDEIEVKLEELSEFSTYSGSYTVNKGKDETRKWLEKMDIPGSTNSINIKCQGIVKVGYDFSKINVKVDDDTIYISLPEPQLNDNYVIWDTVECTESNSILNPIEFSQYQEIIDEIEAEGLKQVEAENIYGKAEANIKVLIEGFLSEFEDYEIVYM